MPVSKADLETVEIVADAMHDPALGLDQSVCLRDLVKALRADGFGEAADHLVGAAREAKKTAVSNPKRHSS